MGTIDEESMALPPEVLATAMRTHQKYFSCLNPEPAPAKAGGSLAPRFLFVANNLTPDDGRTIVAGNERVLRARLADARFFWDQDRKVPLEDRLDQLRERVYHAKLGNLFDKSERIELLAEFLAEHVPGASRRQAQRAALLSKADLSTGMVGEFPELQGVMGRYYTLYPHDPKYREEPRVAEAIANHYKPLGPNDTCPTAPESVVVALADKIDALFGFFWINEKPSGSRDPFALRRAAQGIIRIILENGLRLPLRQTFKCVHTIFTKHQSESLSVAGKNRYLGVGPFVSDVSGEVIEFIADRLKVHLRDQGVRHDLIAAVFALGEDNLVRLLARVDALSKLLGTEEGANLLTAYRRASNIVAIEERRDDRRYDHDVDRALLKQPEEQALFAELNVTSAGANRSLAHEEFEAAMGHLASMRRSVDEFFDKVTVNDLDPALRENRLRLLSRIRAVMNQVADFSQIEG
jgi:glycyl-tRNA synthetase beta chain